MKYKISFYGLTDKGKMRLNNEDNFIIDKTIGFMAVADGMGGHNNGETASKLAIELTYQKFKELTQMNIIPPDYTRACTLPAARLIVAFDYANNKIFEESKKEAENKGMGTTLTSCILTEDNIIIVHIGDSRGYLIREGNLFQITEDDSFVMEQYRKGNLTKEEAENSIYKNILTKALGVNAFTDYFIYEGKIKSNDIILLSTDGLTKMVKDDEILKIISEHKDLETIAVKLIEQANKNGGEDNITLTIARVE